MRCSPATEQPRRGNATLRRDRRRQTTRGDGGLSIVFDADRELCRWRAEPIVQDVYDRLLSLMTAARGAAVPNSTLDDLKNIARDRMWSLLDQHNAVLDEDTRGRIPNFIGAEAAAARLATLPCWQLARTVKAVPGQSSVSSPCRRPTRGKDRLHGGVEAGQAAPVLSPLSCPDSRATRTDINVSRHLGGRMAGSDLQVGEPQPPPTDDLREPA